MVLVYRHPYRSVKYKLSDFDAGMFPGQCYSTSSWLVLQAEGIGVGKIVGKPIIGNLHNYRYQRSSPSITEFGNALLAKGW